MRRYTLTLLPFFLIAAAHAAPIAGTWHCTSSDENVRTDSYITYHPNGSYTENGSIFIDNDDTPLHYRATATGKWQLNKRRLTQTQLSIGNISRHHSASTQDKLAQSPSERQFEESMYQGLAQLNPTPTADIYRLTPNGKLLRQDQSYRAECVKTR